MHKLTLMPNNIEVLLPNNSSLTDVEYELHGQESIPFGCKAGACGACVIEILDGQASLSGRDEDESSFLSMLGYPGEQFRLACQCRLVGAVTIRVAVPGNQ